MCLKPSWVYDLILSISFSSFFFVVLNQPDLSPLSTSFEYRSSLFSELTRRIIDPKFLSQENFRSSSFIFLMSKLIIVSLIIFVLPTSGISILNRVKL